MSVMYLMDMKKYEEAETYTASVLSRLNCRPQEKQPEEDCSHEKGEYFQIIYTLPQDF